MNITAEEALAIYKALRSNWIPPDDQKVVYNLIERIKKELEIE